MRIVWVDLHTIIYIVWIQYLDRGSLIVASAFYTIWFTQTTVHSSTRTIAVKCDSMAALLSLTGETYSSTY